MDKSLFLGEVVVLLPELHLSPTWEWCALPYPGHPHGCPNIGSGPSCPPEAPGVWDLVDLDRPMWWVGSAFDLAEHRRRMIAKHPGWSERKAGCVYYWQPTMRKRNRDLLARFLSEHPGMVGFSPEGHGVNVTVTLHKASVDIRWRYPLAVVHKGWMVGYPLPGKEDHPALWHVAF